MGTTLGQLLDEARERRFVGRSAELERFERALRGDAPHRLLFVHGPGGIGKTTLLAQYRARALAAGRSVVELDGRDHGLTREGVHEALAPLLGADEAPVLLVDGYELLGTHDDWFREELLPSLPAESLSVLAGRNPPATAWRADIGWRELMVVQPLEELDTSESVELLDRVGVDPREHAQLTALAHGLPLALALLADVAAAGRVPVDLASAPDVVEALLPIYVEAVEDAEQAAALELCSRVWVLTPGLLAHRFGERAEELWGWLDHLPYISRSPTGLHPHDLAREVLEAEHDRRNPGSRREVHRIVHRYTREAMTKLAPADAYLLALEVLYLHRNQPLATGFWDLHKMEGLTIVPGRNADHQPIRELVATVEGEHQAALAARWLDLQPAALRVIHRNQELAAYALEIIVPADPALEADDPAVRGVLDAVRSRGPLRPGEQLSIGRFFGSVEPLYQDDPLSMVCGSAGSLVTWRLHSLAWSWIVVLNTDVWEPLFDYAGLTERCDIPGDQLRVAFGIDWRRIGIDAWLSVMAEREFSGDSGPMPAHLLRPRPLGREQFDLAVRQALDQLGAAEVLADNPLAGTRLVDPSGADPGKSLRHSFLGALEELASAPATEELARVLDRTFVRAAPNQEAAAEVLGLSFSTYRRRLSRAVDALGDLLWGVEIGRRDGWPAPESPGSEQEVSRS